jgi:hypothetical protein
MSPLLARAGAVPRIPAGRDTRVRADAAPPALGQFNAFGMASVNGEMTASKRSPSGVTIW